MDDEMTQALVERESTSHSCTSRCTRCAPACKARATALVKVEKFGRQPGAVGGVNGMRHRIKRLSQENQRRKPP